MFFLSPGKNVSKTKEAIHQAVQIDTGDYNYIGQSLYLLQVANEIVNYCTIWC